MRSFDRLPRLDRAVVLVAVLGGPLVAGLTFAERPVVGAAIGGFSFGVMALIAWATARGW